MGLGLIIESKLRPSVGSVVLDLAINEQHAVENEITDQPISTGADEADHAVTRPRRFVIEGIVSSQSASLLEVFRTLRPSNWRNAERHIAAWNRIVEMTEKHEVVRVFNTLEPLDRMMIESARVNRSVLDGLFVTIQLKQLRKSLVKVVNFSDSFADIAAPDTALGTVGTSQVQGLSIGALQSVGVA